MSAPALEQTPQFAVNLRRAMTGLAKVWPLVALVFVVLGALSLRGVRWAYATFILLSIAFFPARTGFRLAPRECDLAFSALLAASSLTNYAHIVLFCLFFVGTLAQFRLKTGSAFAWAAVATTVMGAVVELEQGLTGKGHCRLRDLVPDAAGGLLGAAIMFAWNEARRRAGRPQS